MKIIIPMTGYGSRFVAAGYKELKPFIQVKGKPILEWIINGMYPDEKDILFICRKEHIDNIDGMKDKLLSIAPTASIYEIDDWIKKGPVYDILRASDEIDNQEAAIINYCDFYMTWKWNKVKKSIIQRNCDGCVPCYTGFHPHLLPKKNLYASCRTDNNGNLIEIREKYSFEADKTRAKHSPGVYYFRTGELLKKYCQKLVDSKQELNGEYYASMPYNYMVEDGLKVWIPVNIDYFCQWGTPEDMKESIYWLDIMKGVFG